MSSELIGKWIEEQLNNGKTEEMLDNTVFYDGSTTIIIKKSISKGKFDLRTTFGKAVNLNDLKST